MTRIKQLETENASLRTKRDKLAEKEKIAKEEIDNLLELLEEYSDGELKPKIYKHMGWTIPPSPEPESPQPSTPTETPIKERQEPDPTP